MNGIRNGLRGALAACAVTASLVLIASAPAASASSPARPFLAGAAARGQPPQAVELVQAAAWDDMSKNRLGSGLLGPLAPHATQSSGDGLVRLIVEADDAAQARAGIASAGGRVERVHGHLLQVLIRPERVNTLAGSEGVASVRPPAVPMELAVSGEEVAASLATRWHDEGLTGKGVTVAVIDVGFAGLAERQAAGELPADLVTQDYCDGELAAASRHGTAVAEIVHEVAPDAQLYLLCIHTEVDAAAAVGYAKSRGVQVINHSVGWEGPFRSDGSSPVGALVADARANGILWVNAAGNEAQTHWSGTYRPGPFDIHAWSPAGDQGNSFVWPNETAICGFLKWDEWPAGVSDFDLGLFLEGPNVLLASSEEYQTGTQPPFEGGCIGQSSGSDLRVFWAIRGYDVKTSPRLDLVSWSPPLEYRVAAGSVAEPATSPAALAVGALCWQSRQLEPYSSQGPTISGLTKPDLVGHDAVSGATYGMFDACPTAGGVTGFAGTSASAPGVAGVAALVRQAYPRYTPDQVKEYLVRAARDLGETGPDTVYGAGELQLPAPPDVLSPSAQALPSTGRGGRLVLLRSTVFDDSGAVRVVEQVKRGGRTIATIKKPGYVSTSQLRTVATAWRAPANASGRYRHCVRASDRAGNTSVVSCARITLR